MLLLPTEIFPTVPVYDEPLSKNTPIDEFVNEDTEAADISPVTVISLLSPYTPILLFPVQLLHLSQLN